MGSNPGAEWIFFTLIVVKMKCLFEKTENKRKRGHFLKNRKKSKRGKERERERDPL